MGGKGFQRGPNHPSVLWHQELVRREERQAELAAARKAAALASAAQKGVCLPPGGRKGPISDVEKATVLDKVLNKGVSQLQAGAESGVSQQTVSKYVRLARLEAEEAQLDEFAARVEQSAGSSAAPRGPGRPTKLTPELAERIRAAVARDPFGQVSALYDNLVGEENGFSLRSLYNWLNKLNLKKHAVDNYAQLTESLLHGLLNHKEAVEHAFREKLLGEENLAYADQTPIYMKTGHSSGRGASIVFGDSGDAKGGVKIGNLWAVVTVKGVVRAWLTDKNGDEESAKEFFLSDVLPPGWTNIYGGEGNIMDLLRHYADTLKGRRRFVILCLDRLGKSGASVYAVAGHHAPEIRKRALDAGIGLLLLPPKGALVNPIEIWNFHVKRIMALWESGDGATDDWGQIIRGPRTKDDALVALGEAIETTDMKPACLRSAFHARAAGSVLDKRLKNHRCAQKVRAEREANPVPPFDVKEAAFAIRSRMSTQHPYPSSRPVAETYNVYYYRHYLLGMHHDLPPPFKRPVDAHDGKERSCRLCKPTTKAAKARNEELVCCSSCTGVFHRECVGMEEVDDDDWDCWACVRGDAVQPRVWKKPKEGKEGGARARKKRRAAESDAEESGSEDDA